MPDPPSPASGVHLILYDGVCGLCNRLNTFVLPRDPHGKFHFAPLQSAIGEAILRPFGRDSRSLDTFYIVADYDSPSARLLSKARAALFVGKEIGGVWKLTGIFGILPDWLLNAVYDVIARYRYRIFGRYDTCPVPSPEHKSRFIGISESSGE